MAAAAATGDGGGGGITLIFDRTFPCLFKTPPGRSRTAVGISKARAECDGTSSTARVIDTNVSGEKPIATLENRRKNEQKKKTRYTAIQYGRTDDDDYRLLSLRLLLLLLLMKSGDALCGSSLEARDRGGVRLTTGKKRREYAQPGASASGSVVVVL